jgi:hypothetical protein
MESPSSSGQPETKSGLLDLSTFSLAEVKNLGRAALHGSIRHAVDRTAHILVTASGSHGGDTKRVG